MAAVLLEGDQVPQRQPAKAKILGTLSTLYPDSAAIMGWNIIDAGFEVVFSSRIPSIVREEFPQLLKQFLAQHGLEQRDIGRYLLHPGGAKVITAYEDSLGLPADKLQITREVLRTYGNMSSSTIFFVLDEALRAQPLAEGEYGVLAVFGPGFSAELVLIRG